MAWNEPGGKNNDPWGGGGNNAGPPDLDEALKKFIDKINGVFGGAPGGGKNGPDVSLFGAVALLVIASFVWGVTGFYQVDQQEQAVVLRLGKFVETKGAGLQWNAPLIDKVELVNFTKVRTDTSSGAMLTEDENIVEVDLSVQYTVSDPAAYVLKVRNPELSLAHALESAIRHVVGSSKMDQVITDGREQIAVDVKQRLQRYLSDYQVGIAVTQVNIKDARAPSQVQEAFNDVTRAKEDKERFQNEAEAYANTVIPEARGKAKRQLEEASAYRDQVVSQAKGEADRFSKLLVEYKKAPEVTRERLYIDAVQQVYSDVTKVLVDVEGGNNMMYLPLDKLRGGMSSTPAILDASQNIDIRELTDRVVEQLRRDTQVNRRREGR